MLPRYADCMSWGPLCLPLLSSKFVDAQAASSRTCAACRVVPNTTPYLPARPCRLLGPHQATELGVWVTNIPSHGTGNAISCAECVCFAAAGLDAGLLCCCHTAVHMLCDGLCSMHHSRLPLQAYSSSRNLATTLTSAGMQSIS